MEKEFIISEEKRVECEKKLLKSDSDNYILRKMVSLSKMFISKHNPDDFEEKIKYDAKMEVLEEVLNVKL